MELPPNIAKLKFEPTTYLLLMATADESNVYKRVSTAEVRYALLLSLDISIRRLGELMKTRGTRRPSQRTSYSHNLLKYCSY